MKRSGGADGGKLMPVIFHRSPLLSRPAYRFTKSMCRVSERLATLLVKGVLPLNITAPGCLNPAFCCRKKRCLNAVAWKKGGKEQRVKCRFHTGITHKIILPSLLLMILTRHKIMLEFLENVIVRKG